MKPALTLLVLGLLTGSATTAPAETLTPGLFHPVNVVGDDDRVPLETMTSELSQAEITQISAAIGRLTCPGSKFDTGGQGTGFVIGSGTTLVTNAHILIDQAGRFREPLSACYFTNALKPHVKIPLILHKGAYKFGSWKLDDKHQFDFAVLTLETPIGADFFPVDVPAFGMISGDRILQVSTSDGRLKWRLRPGQLVARTCHAKYIWRKDGGGTTVTSDCDAVPGDSGSPYLRRNRHTGRLIAAGIHVGGGLPTADGLPFDNTTSDTTKQSFSYGIVLDGELAADIATVAKLPGHKPWSRDGRSGPPPWSRQ